MSGAWLVLSWTAAGAAVGTALGAGTWQLLGTDKVRRVTMRLAGPVLTAALFGILAWRLGNMLDLAAYSTVAAVGVPLAIIDTIEQRLPSTLLYPTLGLVGALFATSASVTSNGQALVRALAGMAVLALFYLALALASRGGLGAGDVKLGALLGLVLGWASWSALLAGTLLGWSLGALALLMHRLIRRPPRDTPLPMGAYLLLGAVVTIAAIPPA